MVRKVELYVVLCVNLLEYYSIVVIYREKEAVNIQTGTESVEDRPQGAHLSLL